MNIAVEYIAKKFNIDLIKPSPIQITSTGRDGLATLFRDLGFCRGVEIGVDRGAFSEVLCKANPNLNLVSIDAWSTSAFEDPKNKTEAMQTQLEAHYKSAVRRLSKYNCNIVRKDSLLASQEIADNSIDFVYIDANHNFVKVAADLYEWSKKVRPGGIVSGHDYMHFPPTRDNHVKHVVDAYVKSFEISPYFELGIDRYHSWFWVK